MGNFFFFFSHSHSTRIFSFSHVIEEKSAVVPLTHTVSLLFFSLSISKPLQLQSRAYNVLISKVSRGSNHTRPFVPRPAVCSHKFALLYVEGQCEQ